LEPVAKRAVFSIIVASIASQSLAAPHAANIIRSSEKRVDPLVRCLADAEDRAFAPWWFVPRESGGGTFSNLGAPKVRNPYFVDVADRGGKRELSLRSSDVDAGAKVRILAAIDRCA
jgi:hypothetical protein